MNYEAALSEWQGIETELQQALKEDKYDTAYAETIYLYKAVSLIALALSENNALTKVERDDLLKQSLKLFENIKIDTDAEKYFCALNLALTGNFNKAAGSLKSIAKHSPFYEKSQVLLEQITE